MAEPLGSKKLERELQFWRLFDFDDAEPEFEGYGDSPGDETELMVMLSGMVGGQQLHHETE
ncbi:MAG TPA: hypothetical protein VLV32_07425 [Burkholderiales bacterium]|nr:hypothetical protein [Burkholderiales bacterium]